MKKLMKTSAVVITLVMTMILAACSNVTPEVKDYTDTIDQLADLAKKGENTDPEKVAGIIVKLSKFNSSEVEMTENDKEAIADSYYDLLKVFYKQFEEPIPEGFKKQLISEVSARSTLGQIASEFYFDMMTSLGTY